VFRHLEFVRITFCSAAGECRQLMKGKVENPSAAAKG
jgi:hypothetical protein